MASNQSFYEYLAEQAGKNRGKVIGVLLALVAALLIIFFGFWKTIFIAILILIGYFIGKSFDDKVGLGELWMRMFGKRRSPE
jgi:uncharacterized membrane protein